ncbi:hypothetical protein ABWL39_16595 [Chitinivorax sp. PXF-14]|uniref:hypothetical protein n=1 Tax=Chitinivorax sp. PXF-14 TaxID=3230488 RepID=UPI003465DBCB
MVPGTTAEAAFANTIIAGAIAGGVQSGTLEGAFQGGLTAAAFFGVGSVTVGHGEAALHASAEMKVAQVVGHAAVACASAMASGGQCGPAAIAQAFTTSAGHLGLPEGRFAGTVSRAVVGGLASSLAGGKFSNGAVTAAFAYLFNDLASQQKGKALEVQAQAELNGQGWSTYTNRQIVFEDGVASEMDIIGRRGAEISAIECKNGSCAKWTPNQKSHIDALAEGRYYVKGVLDINPDQLVRDQGKFTASLYTESSTRIMRSPTTARYFNAGGTLLRSFFPISLFIDSYFMARDYEYASKCVMGGVDVCAPPKYWD